MSQSARRSRGFHSFKPAAGVFRVSGSTSDRVDLDGSGRVVADAVMKDGIEPERHSASGVRVYRLGAWTCWRPT
ncbi:MAG: hypothetical protein OXG46_12480 [Chloroflexi bacterium]|nr:hypothetical protein [Chloroflexota bacterium]